MARGDGDIDIEYGVVVNARGKDYGWLPVIWENGRQRGHTYAPHGYDRDEAMARAKQEAKEHAARFIGDWNITVSERAANKTYAVRDDRNRVVARSKTRAGAHRASRVKKNVGSVVTTTTSRTNRASRSISMEKVIHYGVPGARGEPALVPWCEAGYAAMQRGAHVIVNPDPSQVECKYCKRAFNRAGLSQSAKRSAMVRGTFADYEAQARARQQQPTLVTGGHGRQTIAMTPGETVVMERPNFAGVDYANILRQAFGEPIIPERASGSGRVYVVITDKQHARGVSKAAKALGKIFQTKAHYGMRNALYIGYDNATGRELARGTKVVDVLKAHGIGAYRDEHGD